MELAVELAVEIVVILEVLRDGVDILEAGCYVKGVLCV